MEGKKIESSSKLQNYDNHVFAYHEKKEFKAGELNSIPDSEVSYINSSRCAKYHVLKALQNREYNGKFPKDMKIVTVCSGKSMVRDCHNHYSSSTTLIKVCLIEKNIYE